MEILKKNWKFGNWEKIWKFGKNDWKIGKKQIIWKIFGNLKKKLKIWKKLGKIRKFEINRKLIIG